MSEFTGRGADLLVECLVRAGVDRLFGLPGDTGVVFYDALYRRARDIRHVLTRDERHAAAMADGYARVRNAVGVVEVSSGGGTTYVVGGLGDAFASSVPVLLVTSDIHRASRGSGALTEIDQEKLFSAVTKWRATVESAEAIPGVIAEALTAITTGRPAPAAVIIPEDVLDQPVTVPASAFDGLAGATELPRHRPTAARADIEAAAALLDGARNPAVLAGSGVHLSHAYSNLRRLSDTAGIPVATTIHGKGVIADDAPWSIGIAGNNGGAEQVNSYLAEADVVLLVGTRANATDTNGYTGPSRGAATVIGIDIEADRAGRNYPGALKLVGDADQVLGALADRVRPGSPERSTRLRERVRGDRQRWSAGRAQPVHLPEGQLLPAEVIGLAQETMGPVTVVADPGTPTPNVAASWRITRAGRSVIVPRGHGPMGYAIPAAIGAAFATPGRPVLALTADGSFAMACGELETAARFELPIVFVQFTNHSMGWIKMLQHLYSDRRYFGVDPGTVDAVKVAEACGIRGVRARSLAEVKAAIADVSRPVYLDVEVPHMIDHTPPVPAWTKALAGDTERPVY